jgi:hypothetical protein
MKTQRLSPTAAVITQVLVMLLSLFAYNVVSSAAQCYLVGMTTCQKRDVGGGTHRSQFVPAAYVAYSKLLLGRSQHASHFLVACKCS